MHPHEPNPTSGRGAKGSKWPPAIVFLNKNTTVDKI